MVKLTFLLLVGVLRAQCSEWFLARSPHFEVYAETGADRARTVAEHFEQLRSFFDRNQVLPGSTDREQRQPVRVIGFASVRGYEAFKVRSMADAYFTGTSDRDYIVMPLKGENDFAVAAHEYAHFVMFSHRLKLPAWLSEGLPELFSTVRINGRECEFGGPLAARVDTLRRHRWLRAEELASAEQDSPLRTTRAGTAIFYAESWALTDMLSSSPEYGSRFGELIRVLNLQSGSSSQRAVAKIYGKSMDELLRDAQRWIAEGRSSRRRLPSVPAEAAASIAVTSVALKQQRLLVADLLFANREWARSEEMYLQLREQYPNDPDIMASLGTVELRRGNQTRAAEYFRGALDHQLQNAGLCYRYALLADELNLPGAEMERALKRAVALRPDFDDARYKLALEEGNRGDFSEAVYELKAMAKPSGERAFDYWATLAYDLSELEQRKEAMEAADQAGLLAATPEERSRVAEIRYTAETDLNVRFSRDTKGNLQLTTTRVPHGSTNFNPFVEPGDHIEMASGTLREVQCKGGRLTGLLIQSKIGILSLAIPDPLHVQVKNGPTQFFCGAQEETNVTVEYATTPAPSSGLLRGMDFRK